MGDARTQIVANGYDAIGETFAEWRGRIVGDPRRDWEDALTSRLAAGARLLELGCGAGAPESRRPAQRFRLTAVDISPRQVERALEPIPDAEGWTGEWLGAPTFLASPTRPARE
jgi:ubiquinone/menaquinone biosynthesis C-methylase UbiE